jgi:hypothetical protein
MKRLSRAAAIWLLLVAVPLQGYTAAAMVYCGAAHWRAIVGVADRADHAQTAHARDSADNRDAVARSANEYDAGGELANLVHEGGCSVCASCSGAALPAATISACGAWQQVMPLLPAENVDPGDRPARLERPPRPRLAWP